ncbi:Lipoprotein signal peptidase [Gossypium arboreum]|uniref:Lipoprotein signal peptidase n=1 Tax=Gossypium arboreum TaxID=29729 RepID=A0A0B0N2V1_GOSAR|nr:Lipoprotein signal peptidase [Gossypium arboreum]
MKEDEAASTIFSRKSAPPRPLTKLRLGSTSSAPSIARSIRGCKSRVDKGMLSDAACSCVLFEVGIPTMLESWPVERSWPILSTTKAAVDPVPRPRIMPDLTDSTALSAASFLRSSWESTGAAWDLMENGFWDGVRRFRGVQRRIRGLVEVWWREERLRDKEAIGFW